MLQRGLGVGQALGQGRLSPSSPCPSWVALQASEEKSGEMPRRECMKGVRGTGCKQTGRMGQSSRAKTGLGARHNRTWRAPKPELARANSRVGAPTWHANFAVGARQVPRWRANVDLASKKLASRQRTNILQHNNKATEP